MAGAFVIRPFGTKRDSSGKEIDFDRVQRELIGLALEAAGLGGGTTEDLFEPGNIREDMFALLLEADLVVCDITVHNANVFYELGVRHALRKKRTVMIKGRPSSDVTPFDITTDRYLSYDLDNPAAARSSLTKAVTDAMRSERVTDSPIFLMLPTLPEADPATVVVVPQEFREEVNRAKAAKAKGWLRLLAEEVRAQQFEWEGLRLVANGQWDLKDYDGARASWEVIRETYPNDVEANLALANICERLYRENNLPELFEASKQAIDRVLGIGPAARKERAEALALMGRNEKTRWRVEFALLTTTGERRAAAMNQGLKDSYEAYRNAFLEDLIHFYPGLNALQMGTILLDLAGSAAWFNAFESDKEADQYREKLEEEVSALRWLVSTAVTASLRRLDRADPDRVWANISKADMLFLKDPGHEDRVIGAYRDAIPKDKPFAWDATRGQLELLADLGVQSALATSVIKAMDARFPDGKESKPIHLVVFAGHRVDAPGRPEPRFPQEQEGRARTLIHEQLRELLDDTREVVVLASAAPGADILAHELCTELGLTSLICLPMPPDEFAGSVFENLDRWRTRFLDLRKEHKVLVLSDRQGLPRWLQNRGVNPWERGNRWVLKMALTWGAERITLLALWDGKTAGDEPGGTAHMVKLAEAAGRVHIRRIDSTQLTT